MNKATMIPAIALTCALGLFAGSAAAVKPNTEVYTPPTTSSAGGPRSAGQGSGTATTQGRPSTAGPSKGSGSH